MSLPPASTTARSSSAPLPRRIAVTGASGNVGTALLRRLAREDVDVVAIARRTPAHPPTPRSTWHSVDLGHRDAAARLVPLLAGVRAVVHLAWRIQPSHDASALHAVNVDGSRAVLAAAREAGVAHLVHVSSVGAYAPATDPRHKVAVTEDWPVTGIPSSTYSQHKVEVEAQLDEAFRYLAPVGAASGGLALARVRPGLVLQHDAGGQIARYFGGPLLPARLLGSRPLGWVPLPLPLEFTVPVVAADDLAEAIVAVLARRARGAFNVAADGGLDADAIARGLGAKGAAQVPVAALRSLAALTWRARLQPTDPGWVDLAAGVPLLDTTRARTELGWAPATSAPAALAALVAGLRVGAGAGTPPLARRRLLSGRRERG